MKLLEGFYRKLGWARMKPFDLWMEWDLYKKKTKDKNHRKCGKGL
jgi:hypothetical protein